jgi:hypothetical protein
VLDESDEPFADRVAHGVVQVARSGLILRIHDTTRIEVGTMNRPFETIACFALLSLTIGTPLAAQPPIWDPTFGAELTELTGTDDDEVPVALSFPFPYEGFEYTTVFVGANPCVQLGTLGDDGSILEYWRFFDLFYADDDGVGDPEPLICPFNTDTDLDLEGTVHFKDLGNRAVFTWNEVGTHEQPTHLLTFQLQLFDDGTIVFGFNGILDGEGEDLIESLFDGIVVGISLSDGTFPTPEANPWDFSSGGPLLVGDTAYERWCGDTEDSCGEGGDDGFEGPTNAAFDLDQRNVVFQPFPGGGFLVSDQLEDVSTIFSDGFESGDITAWSSTSP